jgi:hypothetical protein
MRISPRLASLLEKAAMCFGDGRNPFRDGEWLSDSDVTFEECEQLSDLIGAVLNGFVKSTHTAQAEVLLAGALGSEARAEGLRAFVEQHDMIQRIGSANQARGKTRTGGGTATG